MAGRGRETTEYEYVQQSSVQDNSRTILLDDPLAERLHALQLLTRSPKLDASYW